MRVFCLDRVAIGEFCRRHGLRKLSLFGSVLREDFRPDSDVDVLVEFRPETRAGYLTMAAMERELSALLERRVDLRTPNELSGYFREDVLRQAEVCYEDPTSIDAACS
ncbi:MAG TPA: nucleotidyltransferase family protein [Thermoanaerobaculia bacterium]|nr:nucleotidyltransferase family protein [Thermoanaerobaculia bacterium]